jgi:maltose alpha-D-glucosyltransferase/alpha-amylase
MLRSFSYAKGAVLQRTAAEPGGERHAPALDAWEAAARRAFVTAYADATRDAGLYASFDDVRGLLELAEIEKLAYELRYELDNRPAWLHIPLAGLAALAARPAGPEMTGGG